MKRYPGIRPFRTDEQALFFGRDLDIERLLRLIELEQLVILYGKSGYGKSSLLAAGIFPILEKQGKRRFWEIRFGPYKAGESLPPADVVRHALARQAAPAPLVPDSLAGPGIWQAAKNCQQAGQGSFLLVFDQFEELFSYPPEQILEFKKQLAEALYAKVPRRVETALAAAALSPEAEDAIYTPFDLKVVFSIRSDRMSLLNGLKDYLPNLLQHGYELDALDEAGAREAICRPAALDPTPIPSPTGRGAADQNKPSATESGALTYQEPDHSPAPLPVGEGSGAGFDTPPFIYTPEALETIFNALRDERGRIETSTLQIVCRYVEDSVVGAANPTPDLSPTGRGAADQNKTSATESRAHTYQESDHSTAPLPVGEGSGVGLVTAADLGDIKSIFRQFYHRTIANLPEAKQAPARRLVEDHLVKDGVRVPYAAQALLTQPGIAQDLLDRLSAASLLRVQRDEAGRMIYEVGHDTLVGPIGEAAQARRAQEERERLQREADEQRREKENAVAARRRARLVALGAVILSLIAIAASLWAWQQTKIASDEADKARRQQALADSSARVAETQRALAVRKQTEADSSAALAQRREAQALAAEQRASEALRQANGNAAVAVEVLLKQAKNSAYHLDYGEARTSLEAAAKLGQQKRAVAEGLYEIAFFHAESGKRNEANELLSTSAQLLGQASAPAPAAAVLRIALETLNPDWCRKMTERYYPVMQPVPGGEFQMGCDSTVDENCSDDELPRHRVRLDDYQLARTETTLWQWGLYCAGKGLNLRDFSPVWGIDGDNPAVHVDWFHAVEYANWLSDRFDKPPVYHIDSLDKERRDQWIVTIIPGAAEKGGFRLPTEAEWEYAARGGPNQYAYWYAGSDDLDAVAWYFGNSDTLGVQRTRPVATRAPLALSPEYRLFDMSGNVWEWCWDWYGGNYYAQFAGSIADNPNGPKSGKYRVMRGCSWGDGDIKCRLAIRYWYLPNYRSNHFGVRLARHSK